jgi:hypothetical protein
MPAEYVVRDGPRIMMIVIIRPQDYDDSNDKASKLMMIVIIRSHDYDVSNSKASNIIMTAIIGPQKP